MGRKIIIEFEEDEFWVKQKSILEGVIENIFSKKKEKELLNSDQLCEWLGISLSSLNVWKRENRIPYKKMGGRVFFYKKEVLEALKDSGYKRLKELGA